jgi:F420-dependent oxidoreductase-like protein
VRDDQHESFLFGLRVQGSGMKLKIGIDVWQQRIAWDALTECWIMSDQAGVDNLWLCDHFRALYGDPPDKEDIFEAWTTLSAMAALTKRARIGVMVTGNTYRHPGILAKMAVTVDHISKGRLEFGLGASDAPWEHEQLGIAFPSAPERLKMLREALTLIKRLWSEDLVDFDGNYYKLTKAPCNPKPVQKPRPPIWIGGEGEKVTLRIVAEHADVWNAIGRKSVEEFVHKMRVLDEHCRAVGRDPTSLRRSIQVHVREDGDVDRVSTRMEELIAAGFSDYIVIVPAPDPRARLEEALRRLLPRFQGMDVEYRA